MEEIIPSFKMQGENLIVEFPKPRREEFPPDRIVMIHDDIEKQIHQIEAQLSDLDKKKEESIKALERAKKDFKRFQGFYPRAEKICLSKLRNFIKENRDKIWKEAEAKIQKDPGMTETEWKISVFNSYRRLVHTNQELVAQVSNNILSKFLYNQDCIINSEGRLKE